MHKRVEQIVQNAKVNYKLIVHAELGDMRSANDVARALGYEAERIAKTLLLRTNGRTSSNRENKNRGATGIPVLMESSLLKHETILIGAGAVAMEFVL